MIVSSGGPPGERARPAADGAEASAPPRHRRRWIQAQSRLVGGGGFPDASEPGESGAAMVVGKGRSSPGQRLTEERSASA